MSNNDSTYLRDESNALPLTITNTKNEQREKSEQDRKDTQRDYTTTLNISHCQWSLFQRHMNDNRLKYDLQRASTLEGSRKRMREAA